MNKIVLPSLSSVHGKQIFLNVAKNDTIFRGIARPFVMVEQANSCN